MKEENVEIVEFIDGEMVVTKLRYRLCGSKTETHYKNYEKYSLGKISKVDHIIHEFQIQDYNNERIFRYPYHHVDHEDHIERTEQTKAENCQQYK